MTVTTINFSAVNVTTLTFSVAHSLETGMEVFFEEKYTDGTNTLVKDTSYTVASVPDTTSVTITTTGTTNVGSDVATTTNVLIPARRLQVQLQFEVAKLEREP